MGSQGSGAGESEPRGPQVSQCREVAGGTSSSGVCLEQSPSTLHVLMVTLLAEGQPWNQAEKSLPPLVSQHPPLRRLHLVLIATDTQLNESIPPIVTEQRKGKFGTEQSYLA